MSEIAQRTPAQELAEQIRGEDFREQLAAALPEGISVDKFARVTVTALMEDAAKTRDPDKQLVNADRGTLYSAVIKCAQDGLLPDGREAALVVFGGKVSYMPMVQGFRKIVGEFGWTVRSGAVYAADEFEYTVEPPTLRHKDAAPGVDRGELVAAYARATHRDGRREQVVLLAPEIAKRKKVSKTDKVWNEWPAQMWAKTAVRDLFNELPLDPADKARVTRVYEASDLAPGEAATLLYGPQAGKPASEEPVQAATSTAEEKPEPGDAVVPAAAASPVEGSAGQDDFGGPAQAGYNPSGAVTDEDVAAAQTAAGFTVQLAPDAKLTWPNGLTLAQIRARDEEGLVFFRWALGPNSGDDLRAAAQAYSKVQLPFLHAELVQS